VGLFTSKPSEDRGDDKRGKGDETRAQKIMRRAGKVAKDELDKATGDKGRLGNRGRGSR
jgi:hypothetical protein